MKDPNTLLQPQAANPADDQRALSRRRFLGFAGAFAGVSMLAACGKDDNNPSPNPGNGGVNLGSGDTGILNYAYALEQLEAAFYTQVVAAGMNWATAAEKALIADVRDHEIAHREFFRAALGSNRIQDLTPNFSTINFTNRQSVLESARAFEDLGVQAYNGAGQLLQSADYLLLAGKIVSVEARHAAYFRDLLVPVLSRIPPFWTQRPASTSTKCPMRCLPSPAPSSRKKSTQANSPPFKPPPAR